MSPDTEYKDGHVPWNFRGVGSPVWHKRDGWYVTIEDRTIAKSRGRVYRKKRRISYARYLWENTYGPFPQNMVVWVREQSPEHLPSIDEMELISRGELMRRNSRR